MTDGGRTPRRPRASSMLLVATNIRFQTARVMRKYAPTRAGGVPGLRYARSGAHGLARSRVLLWLLNAVLQKGLMWPRLVEYSSAAAGFEASDGGEVILDVGSGLSPVPALLGLLNPEATVVATDVGTDWVVEQMLGCSALGLRNVDFVAADSQHLPFRDGTLDQASCISTVEHVPDDGGCMGELRRALREGGTLVFTTDFTGGRFSVRPHGRVYDLRTVLRLTSGFRTVAGVRRSTFTREIHPLVRSLFILQPVLALMARLLGETRPDIIILKLRKDAGR